MLQVVSFGVSAFYSGMWCFRFAMGGGWESVSGQLGLFSGMVCVGCISGAVAWSSSMQKAIFLYPAHAPGVSCQQSLTMIASSHRWYASFVILYSFEFLCLIISKLMLLGRFAANATQSSQAEVNLTGMSGVRRRWLTVGGRALPNVYRVMAGGITVCSAVGMVANTVAGVYYVQAAGVYDQAAAACDAAGSDTNSSSLAASVISAKARTFQSAQAISEALTLLLVSVAFALIVSWGAALLHLVERDAANALLTVNDRENLRPSEANAVRIVGDTMQAAAQQRRRLTVACVIVLITFPARAAFDVIYAYSTLNDPYNPACDICDTCQSEQWLVKQWVTYTPEFHPIVVAVSSPLPLSLSLWIITKALARRSLIAEDMERARAGDVL